MSPRRAAAVLGLIVFCRAAGHATPSFFVYQGRYLNAGTPVNGNTPLEFRVTNGGGIACGTAANFTTVFWTSGSTNVFMANGLFSYKIGYMKDGITPDPSFGLINWNSGTFYMDVCANGTELTPPDLIGNAPFAMFASSANFATNVGAAVFGASNTWTGNQTFNSEVTIATEAYFSAGRLNLGNNSIVNVANPVATKDAANKFYVDAATVSAVAIATNAAVSAVATQVIYLVNGSFSGNNYTLTSSTSNIDVVVNLVADNSGGHAFTITLPAVTVGQEIKVAIAGGPAAGTDTLSIGSTNGGPCLIPGLTSTQPGTTAAGWLDVIGYNTGVGGPAWVCFTK